MSLIIWLFFIRFLLICFIVFLSKVLKHIIDILLIFCCFLLLIIRTYLMNFWWFNEQKFFWNSSCLFNWIFLLMKFYKIFPLKIWFCMTLCQYETIFFVLMRFVELIYNLFSFWFLRNVWLFKKIFIMLRLIYNSLVPAIDNTYFLSQKIGFFRLRSFSYIACFFNCRRSQACLVLYKSFWFSMFSICLLNFIMFDFNCVQSFIFELRNLVILGVPILEMFLQTWRRFHW